MGSDETSQHLNVTMFHYRGTGNRTSSVLLGLQVPRHKEHVYDEVRATLEPLDFSFDELDAETRQLFDQFVS
jgi:C-terminal regulatory domain of Threonine dehydratase